MTNELPDGWRWARLGGLTTKIGSGATPRGGEKAYLPQRHTYAIVRSQNVFDWHLDVDRLAYITDEDADRLSNVALEAGDVLLNITGDGITFARTCMAPADVLPARVNQHVAIIRSDRPQLDPGFLLAYLAAPTTKHYIESFNAGGSRRAITKANIESFLIPLPPLPEQRAIAHVLGSLDDKIELNRRMNETLEAMARAIFQSWFVDFDPVWAKKEGRQPVGMDAATAALFPDDFEDSELGEIPKGWEVGSIGDEVTVVGGSTPSTANPEYWEGGTHYWATPKDLNSLSSPVLLSTDRCITDEGLGQISSGPLPAGTVLLSSRAPVGYLAIAEVPIAVNQGFIAMVCQGRLPNQYVLQWARHNMETIIAHANGTTFLEVSKRNFRPIPVLVPSPETLPAFVRAVDPAYRLVVNNLRQSRTLAAIRDALLPKLLSGEIRIDA